MQPNSPDSGPAPENLVPAPTEPAPARLVPVMKVFGVGGAGCNILVHLVQSGFEGVECVAMNTDAAALERCAVPTRLALGSRLTRGLGAGGDPERGRAAAAEDREKLQALCAGADVIFIMAGLGGGTGTGASPLLAEVAGQSGALVLGMVVLPFDWEGERRRRQAQFGLHQLRAAADSVVCLPNQKLLGLVADKTSLLESFATAHDLLARGVHGLRRLLTQPGLINVDFADVCAVTRDRHAECSLATAEARGDARAHDLVERLLRHPLLEEGRALDEASGVLVSLVGGPDLSLTDVNEVMEQLNHRCERSHVILGATVDPGFAGRLAITLLSTRAEGNELPDFPVAAGTAAGGAVAGEPPFIDPVGQARPASRIVAPPPAITPENASQMLNSLSPRARRKAMKMVQGQLPLEMIAKGRFERSEPTIRSGEDLDVPTYLRHNLVFN